MTWNTSLIDFIFNLYTKIKDKIDFNKDNIDIIYQLIQERIEELNQNNCNLLEHYDKIWNGTYNDKYIK